MTENGFPGNSWKKATQADLVPLALTMYEEVVKGAAKGRVSPVDTMSAAVRKIHMQADLNETNPFIHPTVRGAIQRLGKVVSREAPPPKHAPRMTDGSYERVILDCLHVC